MLSPMSDHASRDRVPNGRFRGRIPRLAAALTFVLALLFAAGIETVGHHHDTPGGEQHCAICRVVIHNSGTAPSGAAPVLAGLPPAPEVPRIVVLHDLGAPHLLVLRLRAPPAA